MTGVEGRTERHRLYKVQVSATFATFSLLREVGYQTCQCADIVWPSHGVARESGARGMTE